MKLPCKVWCVVCVAVVFGMAPSAGAADVDLMGLPNALQDDPAAAEEVAVVALREGCDNEPAFTLDGSGNTVIGAIRSNGGIELSGSGNTVTGPITSPCDADVSGASIELGSGVVEAAPVSSPVEFQPDGVSCDFEPPGGDISSTGPWWEGGRSVSGQLRDGVYCAEGALRLTGSSVIGRVTLVATGSGAEVRLTGSSLDLQPYEGDTLIWSEGTGEEAIEIDGSSGDWRGIISAPNGGVSFSQSGGESAGTLIVAETVDLSGSGWEIAGLPIALAEPEDTGAIVVHAHECPFRSAEDRKEFNWFDICLPGPEGVVFELTSIDGDLAETGTTDADGELRFEQLPEGTYDLRAVDALWCRATSDSVNAQGQVELEEGEEANVWIFFCESGS